YDEAAHIQREICSRLSAFAMTLDLEPALRADAPVLDAGCGTGFGFAELDRLCPGAARIALDLAPSMLKQAGRRHALAPATSNPAEPAACAGATDNASDWLAVCGDLEQLPLASASLAL